MSSATAHERVTAGSIALLLLVGISWGLNWPAVRVLLHDLPPWTLRGTSLLLGSLGMLTVCLVTGTSLRVPRREIGAVVATGLLTVFAFNILITFGQLNAPTAQVAIVAFTMPAWAALLARPILGEPLTVRKLLALALGLTGLALLLGDRSGPQDGSLGLGFGVLGAIAWASGTVLTKKLRIDVPPLALAFWWLLVSAIPALLIGWTTEAGVAWSGLPLATWGVLAFHVALPMVFGYAAWSVLVRRLPAGTAALGTLLVPVVGVTSAALLLGEPMTWRNLSALALVLTGLALVLLHSNTRPGT